MTAVALFFTSNLLAAQGFHLINAVSLRFLRAFVLTGIITATGCGTVPPSAKPDNAPHREGAVTYSKLAAPPDQAYKLTQTEHAFGAQPITNEAPAYPESLVGKALPPTTIRVKAIVDDAGHVSDVRDLDASSDPDHQALFAACKAAVMRWTYSPMTIVQESDDGRGNISQVRKNAAFSLDYAFQFEIVDGRPRVTTSK
jgi:hypothetical protein